MREMKDSGVEWIGEIPKDWKIKKPKYIGSIRSGDSVTNKKLNDDIGYEVLGGNGTIGFYDKYNVDGTHIIIGRVGALCGNSRITRGKKFISDNALIYTCFEGQAENYINYIFDAFNLNKLNTSNAQPLITGSKVLNIFIPYPYIIEQKIIADFLDTKCSEIDATAEDIQKEISLLEDYKKSVITEVVTKGLDPDAEMKDSGVAWIGEIPKEWKIIRFKYVAIVKSNLVAPFRYMDYPQIAPDIIEKDTGNIILHRSVKEASVDSWNHLFYKGQILYSKIRPVLNKVTIAPYDGLCSADMYPISAKENVRFLQYIMLSAFFIKQVDLVTRDRIKMPKINQDDLGNILLVVPSKEEQQQIADFLDAKCSEIDTIIADKKRQLDILAECKKSLIYEYVTGKKEVPINE